MAVNAVSAANLKDAFGENSPLKSAAEGAGYDTGAGNVTDIPETIFGEVIKIALSFVGVIFLALMIYSGYLWMTAAGNESQVEKSKKLIVAAIIGLTIVMASYAISYYIIKMVSDKTMTVPTAPSH